MSVHFQGLKKKTPFKYNNSPYSKSEVTWLCDKQTKRVFIISWKSSSSLPFSFTLPHIQICCIVHYTLKTLNIVCMTQIWELILGWIIALILDSVGNSQDLKLFTHGDVVRLMITVDFLWAEHRKQCLVITVHSIVFLQWLFFTTG